jgi:hypothetical protein
MFEVQVGIQPALARKVLLPKPSSIVHVERKLMDAEGDKSVDDVIENGAAMGTSSLKLRRAVATKKSDVLPCNISAASFPYMRSNEPLIMSSTPFEEQIRIHQPGHRYESLHLERTDPVDSLLLALCLCFALRMSLNDQDLSLPNQTNMTTTNENVGCIIFYVISPWCLACINFLGEEEVFTRSLLLSLYQGTSSLLVNTALSPNTRVILKVRESMVALVLNTLSLVFSTEYPQFNFNILHFFYSYGRATLFLWSKLFSFEAGRSFIEVLSRKAVITIAFLAATSISYFGNIVLGRCIIFLLALHFFVYKLFRDRGTFHTPKDRVRVKATRLVMFYF